MFWAGQRVHMIKFKSLKVSIVKSVSTSLSPGPLLYSLWSKKSYRFLFILLETLSQLLLGNLSVGNGKEEKRNRYYFLLYHLPVGTEWHLDKYSLMGKFILIKKPKSGFSE